MTEELKKELKKYHRFPKKTAKLKDILALVRCGAYSNYYKGKCGRDTETGIVRKNSENT